MEHRLITGGYEFLPFARSCITKLKKLGLPYAGQSYEINGVSIKVRIEPEHEYIRIEGGGARGFIEAMFLSGPNNPAAAAERAAYLAAKVEAEKSPKKPKLLGYSVKDAKWFTRGSTGRGSPIGYSVVYTPERIPAKPVGDKDYFDVVYKSGKNLVLSTRSGIQKILSDLTNTYESPFLLSPKKDAQPETSESEKHVFFASPTGVEHIPVQSGITDVAHKAQDALDVVNTIGANMPYLASAVGLESFGVVSDVSNLLCSSFGTRATYDMAGEYLNIYYWCISYKLTRLTPYIEINKKAITLRNYHRWVDVATGATTTNESLDSPGASALSSTSVTIADIMEDSFALVRTEPAYGYDWYVRTGRYPAGTIGSDRTAITGTSNPITFKNTVTPYNDSYESGCQTGVVMVTHLAKITIDFSYEGSFATASAYGPAPPESADYWVGLYYPMGMTETPRVITGMSVVYTNDNTSSTSVSYKSGGNLLFSMVADVKYHAVESTTTSFNLAQTSRLTDGGGGGEFSVPLGAVPFVRRYFSWSISGNVVITPVETSAAQWGLTSSATITIRDYLFHDISNNVAVYVESVASGTKNSTLRGSYDGDGRWDISVVVDAKGKKSEFRLARITNSGHNLELMEHDFLINKVDQPTYIDAITNIALYSPVCEQGAFPYIAYTTSAEESLGVPARFILSMPLSLINPNDVFGVDPAPPDGSYAFTPYNLADASDLMKGSKPLSGVVGKCYQISVSHDGKRNWLADIAGSPPANCYRV